MDYKRIKTEPLAVTRDIKSFDSVTGNIYESIMVIAKRANQINQELKEELNSKISEFSTSVDNLEEVFENREQIELARYYESLPKPTLMAIWEWHNGRIYYRNPLKDNTEL